MNGVVVGHRELELVEIVVADTGIGIAAEDQERLFQPFVQLDGRLSREYSGTGLGLVLVKRLVEAHAGTVTLTSRRGEGSRFSVELPWVVAPSPAPADGADGCVPPAPPPPATAMPAGPAGIAGPGGRPVALPASAPEVLVVDDDAHSRTILCEVLAARGYRVRSAASGPEALASVGERRPALVLMDVQMPGMDGLEAIAALRRLPSGADLPVVAVTALAMTGDRERCLDAGADGYLAKPVRFAELTSAVERLLRPRHRS
jgi:CheY-like chemotaxis protein